MFHFHLSFFFFLNYFYSFVYICRNIHNISPKPKLSSHWEFSNCMKGILENTRSSKCDSSCNSMGISRNCNLLPIEHGGTLFFSYTHDNVCKYIPDYQHFTLHTICIQIWFVACSVHVYNNIMSQKHLSAKGTYIFRSF